VPQQRSDLGWNLGSDTVRFAEVPEMTAGILRFPGDRVASFASSFGATDRSTFEIIGTKGVLEMDPAYEMVEDLKAEITVDGKTVRKTYKMCDDVRVIEALLKSANSNRPVEIAATEIPRKPSIEREISKPPVARPPQPVNAAAPGASH
jgi:hypothetical protein